MICNIVALIVPMIINLSQLIHTKHGPFAWGNLTFNPMPLQVFYTLLYSVIRHENPHLKLISLTERVTFVSFMMKIQVHCWLPQWRNSTEVSVFLMILMDYTFSSVRIKSTLVVRSTYFGVYEHLPFLSHNCPIQNPLGKHLDRFNRQVEGHPLEGPPCSPECFVSPYSEMLLSWH